MISFTNELRFTYFFEMQINQLDHSISIALEYADIITAYHLPCINHHHCLPLAPVSMCSYCLPNPHSFCKIHCSLSCAALPCALLKYLFNRMANDESTAWFRVQHCLKPLRPLKKKCSGYASRLVCHGFSVLLSPWRLPFSFFSFFQNFPNFFFRLVVLNLFEPGL